MYYRYTMLLRLRHCARAAWHDLGGFWEYNIGCPISELKERVDVLVYEVRMLNAMRTNGLLVLGPV